MNILLTGGMGYIGTHTAIELLNAGHHVVIVDNLVNSSPFAGVRVEKIAGRGTPFYDADVCDAEAMKQILVNDKIEAVIHLAGLKAVGESVEKPLEYYRNNIDSTLSLLEAMQFAGVKRLVFSSSATVYGAPSELPLKETSTVGIGLTNPYGRTKYMIEEILRDVAKADETLNITILRYFNPIGAHDTGYIGEDPKGTPNNLLPYIAQVAVGKRKFVGVFGNDYDTPDGTGVRDYIHVVDLARGHVAAINHPQPGLSTYNLGTGKGTSVLELIAAFSRASGKHIPYSILPRRAGDIATCYCDPSLANEKLGWHAELTIEDACRDAWKWHHNNPSGYEIPLELTPDPSLL